MDNQNNMAKNGDSKKSNVNWSKIILIAIIISAIFGSIFGFMAFGISQKILPRISSIVAPITPSTNKEVLRQQIVEEDSAVIDVVDKSSPAVVSIVITKDIPKVQDFFSNPFNFPDFYSPFEGPTPDQNNGNTERQKVGGGSGFLIANDGMIITNRHVIDDTSAEYTVITNDNKEYSAKILAKDPINDIAIVKIEGSNFPTLNLGDSDSLKIGQTVIAIGNSLGEFSNTVSKGIISGLKRTVTAGGGFGESEQLKNIIQTDAAINLGNSGGPLLNISGEVVGINVAMAQGAQNIGFAIPSNQIKKIISQVQTTGKISVPYLGVRYVLVDKTIQQENNLPFGYGALILRGQKMTDFAVIPGSPADKAGLTENDIILEVNGNKIDQNNSLADLIVKYNVGDTITLKIWDKGKEKTIQVILAELKQ